MDGEGALTEEAEFNVMFWSARYLGTGEAGWDASEVASRVRGDGEEWR